MGNTQGSFQPLDMLLQTWNGGAGGSTQENAVLPTYLQSLPFPTQPVWSRLPFRLPTWRRLGKWTHFCLKDAAGLLLQGEKYVHFVAALYILNC